MWYRQICSDDGDVDMDEHQQQSLMNNNNNALTITLIDNDINISSNIKSNVFNLLKLKFKNQQLGKKLWLERRELTHYDFIPIEFSKDEYFVSNFFNRMNKNKYFKEYWYGNDYTNILSDEVKLKFNDTLVFNSEIYNSFDRSIKPSILLINTVNKLCNESETKCIEIISRLANRLIYVVDEFLKYKDQFPFIDKLLNIDDNSEFILKCISYNYKIFTFIEKQINKQLKEEQQEYNSTTTTTTMEFIIKCTTININVLEFIDFQCSIFKNKQFLMKILQSSTNKLTRNNSYAKYFSIELLNDRELILLASEKGFNVLEFIKSKELKNDREIVLNCVKHFGFTILYASIELQQDLEVILSAIKTCDFILDRVSNELKNDREFVLKCVKMNGKSIYYIPHQFKLHSDIEIMNEVMKQNPLNIQRIIDNDIMINNCKNTILNSIDTMNFEYKGGLSEYTNILKHINDLDILIKLIETIPFSIHFINEKFKTNYKELLYKSTLLHSGYWMKQSEDAFQHRINHSYYSAKIDSTVTSGGDGGNNEINYYRNLNKEHLLWEGMEWKEWSQLL